MAAALQFQHQRKVIQYYENMTKGVYCPFPILIMQNLTLWRCGHLQQCNYITRLHLTKFIMVKQSMKQRLGFRGIVKRNTATEWGRMVKHVVADRIQHMQRDNTCKLRELLHQLDKTCATNTHNTDKQRNALQVAKMTTNIDVSRGH